MPEYSTARLGQGIGKSDNPFGLFLGDQNVKLN